MIRMDAEIKKQRAYYSATAKDYDAMHVSDDDEHAKALALFAGLAAQRAHASILDIGAGTGRALRFLKSALPESNLVGIEPVAQLREAGLGAGGLDKGQLRDGDATALAFDDNAFDWVIETGVLHHIKDFRAALREMMRVARVGILISDSNNMGQGGRGARRLKQAIKALGLWEPFVYLQTRGKGYKWSEGDGVYYSFCAFDCVPVLQEKFPMIHYCNTQASGFDLYGSAPHVAILAYRDGEK